MSVADEERWSRLEALYEEYLADSGKLRRDFTEEVLADFERGTDLFYANYKTDSGASEDIRRQFGKQIADMDIGQQYNYLVNVMIAISAYCGGAIRNTDWGSVVQRHQRLAEQAGDYADDITDEEKKAFIDDVLETAPEMIEAASFLLLRTPFQRAINDVCRKAGNGDIKAMVMNDRVNTVAMAAAMYKLARECRLNDARLAQLSAVSLGTMAAAALEADAAAKTQSWTTAKDVIARIMRAAIMTLMTIPVLGAVTAGVMLTYWFLPVTLLSQVMFVFIGAAALFNVRVQMKLVNKQLQGFFENLNTAVDITLDKVHDVFGNIASWAESTVVPKAKLLYERAADFTFEHVILPVLRAFKAIKTKLAVIRDNVMDAYENAQYTQRSHANGAGAFEAYMSALADEEFDPNENSEPADEGMVLTDDENQDNGESNEAQNECHLGNLIAE